MSNNIQLNSIENSNNSIDNIKNTESDLNNNIGNNTKNNLSVLSCLSSSSSSTTSLSVPCSTLPTTTTTTTTQRILATKATSINITTQTTSSNCNNNEKTKITASNLVTQKSETREIDTITDICCSDNIAEVDLFSLINDNLPLYKLRADTLFTHNNTDWIEAPLYVDDNTIGELTNEQIKYTLDYFILSGFRVSAMTKTYYDIDAVSKLLEEKEKDLELAATIGKHLLDKGQVLETKIEILEEQLDKASDMVNQLRHEITMKDDLLQNFIEFENENAAAAAEEDCLNRSASSNLSSLLNSSGYESIEHLKKTISKLENENYLLKNDADNLKDMESDLEMKEKILVENCVQELMHANSKLETIQEELKFKTKESSQQQDEIGQLYNTIMELQGKIKSLTIENSELQSLIGISASTQNDLAVELMDIKSKYNECLDMLQATQEELRMLRRKYTKKNEMRCLKQQQRHSSSLYAPWMTANSFAAELHFGGANNNEQSIHDYKQKRDSFDLVRKVREKLIKTVPGSTVDSCFPSDSEYESMITSSSSLNFNSNNTIVNLNNNALLVDHQHHPRSDSHISTYSGGSCFGGQNNMRSYLPDKLQIVKPLEGSQTLHHWQQLATPNLGCLIEPRPGIYIKGKDPNVDSNSSTSCSTVSSVDSDRNIDLTALRRLNKAKNADSDMVTSDLDDTINLSYIEDDNDDNDYYANNNNNAIHNGDLDILPTIISLDNLNNININERLVLKNLLNSQQQQQQQQVNVQQTTATVISSTPSGVNPYLDEIKNLSQKYYMTPLISDNLKINNKKIKHMDLVNKLNDLNLFSNVQNGFNSQCVPTTTAAALHPDTPPPSPTNELAADEIDDELVNINENCKYNDDQQQVPHIATPPTSPFEKMMNSNSNSKEIKLLETNFVNEIIERLSIFSFNPSAPVSFTQTTAGKESTRLLVKPLALYATEADTVITPVQTPSAETVTTTTATRCETPPPSPTLRQSPTPSIPINDEMLANMDEKRFQESAFIKLSTMNPLINKSIDLSKLLGSLTSLKRSQRFH